MTTEELYKPHIQKAANAFAYSKALDLHLKIIQCAGFEGGIRILCEELLEDGVVNPQRLLNWLETKTRIKPDNETWWIQNKNS